MTDVDLTGTHPCPVPNCRLSAEEHHRVNVGLMAENSDLRRQQRERWPAPETTLPDVVTGTPLVLERGRTYVITSPNYITAEFAERIRAAGDHLDVKFLVLDNALQIAREVTE